MKLAVLGANGLLGRQVVALGRRAGADVAALDLGEMDVTAPAEVRKQMPSVAWCINCSGFTSIEDAEQQRARALAVNVEGARAVAATCARRGIRLMHVSDSMVFDGRKIRPYTELDEPAPVNFYGHSKFVGERDVRAEGGHFLVVRLPLLFGWDASGRPAGALAGLNDPAPFVAPSDETVAPTYARHAAEALIKLIEQGRDGLVHVGAGGRCTWAEFAREAVGRIRPDVEVRVRPAAEIGGRAPRPPYSVLDTRRFAQWTGHIVPTWRQGVEDFAAAREVSDGDVGAPAEE